MALTLDHLRHYAVGRSLFAPTTLRRALERLGFVQADPIRAPARAQDLMLRHRVKGYRAGDLERQYARLGIEEDFFVVYGFVTQRLHKLMHPRGLAGVPANGGRPWPKREREQAELLLKFVRDRGETHPREADEYFGRLRTTNWFGGSSSATTQLLGEMHYRGLLRVTRRDSGTRVYAAHEHGPAVDDPAERAARLDALADAAIGIYAPLPSASLTDLVRRLKHGAPQWRDELKATLQRAKTRLAHARVDGVDWYWPAGEKPERFAVEEVVRLLAPFDPVVWDRDRLELLWGWVYRFEAYTPPPKRKLGYYAMPLLWRDRVIGWANVRVEGGQLRCELGYVNEAPKERAFRLRFEEELERMRGFLGIEK